MGSDLGVEGVESGFEILGELVKCFLRGRNGSIGHPVIPGFSIKGFPSIAHLV